MRSCTISLRLATLCAALGCGRALDLPAPRTAPTITALSPAEGYADDRLAISGSGFDPLPANNQIFFQGQTTTGDSFDAQGNLLVYVPYNLAAPGPVAIATPAGRSQPFGNFINLGSGHPTLGVTVGDARVRHDPPALAAVAGDLFVPSRYFRLLLSRQGAQLLLPATPVALALSADGARLAVALGDATLREIDRATLALSPAVPAPFAVQTLCASGAAIFAVGAAADGSLHAQAFGTPGLVSGVSRTIPALAVHGAVAAADGRHLVLSVDRDAGGTAVSALLVLDLQDASAPPVFIAPPAGRSAAAALADFQVSGTDTVAVALDDGSMALLTLSAAPAFGAPIPLVSQGRVGGFAAAAGVLLATKPEEGMALVVDPQAGAVRAAIALQGQPALAVADAASGHAFVADAASNGFDEIDLGQSKWLGRFDFGTGLGDSPACDCAPAPAYDREDQGSDHHLYFLAPRMRQLVALDSYTLALLPPAPLVATASRPLGVVGTPDGSVWVLHQSEIGQVRNNVETLALSGFTEQPAGLVASDGALVVRSLHGLSVFRNGARVGGWSRSDGTVTSLFADGAGLVAVWTRGDGSVHAGRWTAATLAAGAEPAPAYDSPSGLLGSGGALDLGMGPLIFFSTCGAAGACTVQLDPALGGGPPSPSPLDRAAPLRSSPDGRYFLWSRSNASDSVLHMASASSSGLRDYTSWQVPAGYAQPSFDPSGEWLYVPVPALDEVHVLQ